MTISVRHIAGGGILEVGCGKSYILKWMQGKGYSTIEGVDLSPEDVEVARKYVEIDTIWCADASEYLLGKESVYDCIWPAPRK